MNATENPEPEFYLPIYLPEPKLERGPSPRNRAIFQAVQVEHMTHRDAAVKFNLSNGRIGQIVHRVEEWIVRTGGGPTRTWGERMRLTEYMHRQRLALLQAQAQNAWNKSQDPHTTKITIVDGKEKSRVIALKPSRGDVKYLEMSLKVCTAMQAFEDSRELPPDTEEMTNEERIREAGLVAAEAVRRFKAEAEARKKEVEMTKEEVVALEAPQAIADSQPPRTNDPGPMTNEQLPPAPPAEQVVNPPAEAVDEPAIAPSPLPTCSTRRKFGTSPFDMYVGRIRRPKPPDSPPDRNCYGP